MDLVHTGPTLLRVSGGFSSRMYLVCGLYTLGLVTALIIANLQSEDHQALAIDTVDR